MDDRDTDEMEPFTSSTDGKACREPRGAAMMPKMEHRDAVNQGEVSGTKIRVD